MSSQPPGDWGQFDDLATTTQVTRDQEDQSTSRGPIKAPSIRTANTFSSSSPKTLVTPPTNGTSATLPNGPNTHNTPARKSNSTSKISAVTTVNTTNPSTLGGNHIEILSPRFKAEEFRHHEITSSPSCPDFGSLEAAHSRVASSGLTISEAKGELWTLRLAGPLLKRGFRHRKKWVRRWLVLAGRMLAYYEKPSDEKIGRVRGFLELSKGTCVVETGEKDGMFGFNVIPGPLVLRQQETMRRNSSNHRFMAKSPPGNQHAQRRQSSTVSRATSSSNAGIPHTVTAASLAPPYNRRSSAAATQVKPNGMPPRAPTSSSSSWFSWFTGSSPGGGGPPTNATNGSEPSGKNQYCVWRFKAASQEERRQWIKLINKSVALINRVEVAPTLCGVGSIHDHYEIGRVLRAGAFGYMRVGVAKVTGQQFCIKIVNKNKSVRSAESARVLKNEIRIMRRATRQLNHMGICKLFQAYEDGFMVYLVLEHLKGGNLQDRVERFSSYSEKDAAVVVMQLASALEALHKHGIILCDLHPKTIYYSNRWSTRVKITDFSKALILPNNRVGRNNSNGANGGGPKPPVVASAATSEAPPRDATSGEKRPKLHIVVLRELIGSPGVVAPETIKERKYSTACDVWALGCILYFMLSGNMPFTGESVKAVLNSTLEGLQVSKLRGEASWKETSVAARRMTGSMLNPDPQRRATATELLQSEWVKEPPVASNTNLGARQREMRKTFARRKLKALFRSIRLLLWLTKVGRTANSIDDASSPGHHRNLLDNSLEVYQQGQGSPPMPSESDVRAANTGITIASAQVDTTDPRSPCSSLSPLSPLSAHSSMDSPTTRTTGRSWRQAGDRARTSSSEERNPAVHGGGLSCPRAPTRVAEARKQPIRKQGSFLLALEQQLQQDSGIVIRDDDEHQADDAAVVGPGV